MIYTSSYDNCQSNGYMTYSISGNRGKDANYKGNYYSALAPKISFWKVWHDNVGKISEEENNRYYVQEYWNQVLSKLDPEKVFKRLDYSILLCYEPNTDFCHRHIVAAWFEILLGLKIPEVKITGFHMQELQRPEYIKQYLEDAMRKTKNMRGFQSLRALYMFEQSEELESRADEAEERTGKCFDHYRQAACFLRCDADMLEEKYRKTIKNKSLTKKK